MLNQALRLYPFARKLPLAFEPDRLRTDLAAIDESWWATIFPCLMLFLTVLSFNLIGERLSRRFDIRQAGV